jgi:hypothetical protein
VFCTLGLVCTSKELKIRDFEILVKAGRQFGGALVMARWQRVGVLVGLRKRSGGVLVAARSSRGIVGRSLEQSVA